jgi:rare lipoprotein A
MKSLSLTAAPLAAFLIAVVVFTGPGYANGRICGIASWYGSESGHRTATGAYFDGSSMTAAMPSRSMLGRRVRVTDMRTGRSVVVLVNDIGPARWTHRVIDLSRAAARALGMDGVARVCLDS